MKKSIIVLNTLLVMAVLGGCGDITTKENVAKMEKNAQVTVEAEPTPEVTIEVEQPTQGVEEESIKNSENTDVNILQEEDKMEEATQPSEELLQNQETAKVTEPETKTNGENMAQGETVALEEKETIGETVSEEEDKYVGEYKDYDNDETNLWISKKEDGTYDIDMGLFRITTYDDCVGTLTEDGLEFITAAGDERGIITVNGDIVTVKFTEATYPIENGREFEFHK